MTINHKILATINFIIVGYFVLIYVLYKFDLDYKMIGALIELLTIPFLIAQVVFLFIGIRLLFKKKMLPFTFMSFVLLVVCSILSIGSFFLKSI